MVIEADISQIGQISEIERENFLKPWSYKLIYDEIRNENSDVYAYMSGNRVAGYMVIRQIIDEVELLNISVHKDFRRIGIAGNLLDFLISKSGNCSIFLEVRENNFAAINLYEKKGFKKVGLRKDYYSKGTNGIVMKLYVQGVQDVKNESGCCTGVIGK